MCICSRCIIFASFVFFIYFPPPSSSIMCARLCVSCFASLLYVFHLPTLRTPNTSAILLAIVFLFCDASIGDTVSCTLYLSFSSFPAPCLRSVSVCLVSSSAFTPVVVFLIFVFSWLPHRRCCSSPTLAVFYSVRSFPDYVSVSSQVFPCCPIPQQPRRDCLCPSLIFCIYTKAYKN